MSRTNHHRSQRGLKWGWDLWSRRGDMGCSSMHNSFNRKQTIKRERRIFKEIDRLEVNIIGPGSGD